MTSTNNNNQKNQVDTTDLEFGSFNEEEDQFINKKQLVHIEDDTSINVDVSEDDRSKSSSLKKSFLINNISALNEQFPSNNQIGNKKYNENDLNDMTNSADFYNSQNGLGNIPESKEEKNQNDNINNEEVIQFLETKIDNNGFFFSRKNKEILESENNNNLNNDLDNKKINLKNKNDDNISIKDIDDEDIIEEEEYDNDNLYENNNNMINNNNKDNTRTSQMMIKRNLTPNEIINKYITNQNINNYNEEYLNSNINSKDSKSPNFNSNDFNINAYTEENFNFNIIGTQAKLSGSVNTSEQTFGLMQSNDLQNKYSQLEAKYNSLLTQNKKLEENYQELKNSNKSVLDLLTYWQKFYLEILEIVKPKSQNKNIDNSTSDYMDDPYRIQVINEVKKMVLMTRDKAYNIFYITPTNSFDIKGKINKLEENNKNKNNVQNLILSLNKIESLFFEGNDKNYNKNIDKEDDINSAPRHIEKINIGINTDFSGDKISNTKDVIKEKENKNNRNQFDKRYLNISSKVQNISYIKKNNSKKKENIKQNINNEEKNNFVKFKMCSNIKLNYKGLLPKQQKKFKKNIMHKIAIVQTDMTYKNINSIETLNKACSSQLLNAQKEKEKMQKLYEEKITSLNNYINENIKPAKKEKEKNKNNKNKEKEEKEEKEKEDIFNNLNTSLIFLPEMIPPENTYKIFIHCVKHFKYEEDIYKKYLEEEDLYILKAFVEKMEKYLVGASLPLLKYKKSKKGNKIKENKESNTININYDNENIKEEISQQPKIKENNVIHNVKQKFSNTKLKLSNNSENKVGGDENKKHNIYNNNNTFNKYKAAIMALKDD